MHCKTCKNKRVTVRDASVDRSYEILPKMMSLAQIHVKPTDVSGLLLPARILGTFVV